MDHPASSRDTPQPGGAGTKAKGLAGMLIAAGIGAAFGAGLVVAVFLAHDGDKARLRALLGWLEPWDALWLPVAMFMVILVHEAGHVTAGLARGMRFVLLTAGPLQVVRVDGGLRIGANKVAGLWGGMAALAPSGRGDGARDFLWLVLGGPTASLMLAAAGFALSTATTGRPAGYAGTVAAISLLIGLVTLVPMTAGGMPSDGKQVLGLLRRAPWMLRRSRLQELTGLSMGGTRPRDLPTDTIAAALAGSGAEPGDAATDVAARWFALLAALDRGDTAQARPLIAELAGGWAAYPAGFRQGIAALIAHALARDGDRAAAGDWLERAKGGLGSGGLEPLTRAVLAATAPDADARAVAAAAAEARTQAAAGIDRGLFQFIRDEADRLAPPPS